MLPKRLSIIIREEINEVHMIYFTLRIAMSWA